MDYYNSPRAKNQSFLNAPLLFTRIQLIERNIQFIEFRVGCPMLNGFAVIVLRFGINIAVYPHDRNQKSSKSRKQI